MYSTEEPNIHKANILNNICWKLPRMNIWDKICQKPKKSDSGKCKERVNLKNKLLLVNINSITLTISNFLTVGDILYITKTYCQFLFY